MSDAEMIASRSQRDSAGTILAFAGGITALTVIPFPGGRWIFRRFWKRPKP